MLRQAQFAQNCTMVQSMSAQHLQKRWYWFAPQAHMHVGGFVVLRTRYHTGNGFFINSSLLMFSLLINAWLCLLLALSSATAVGSTVLADALALLGGLQLLQLGSLSLLVYIATVWLEDGFLVTLKNVLKQLVSGEAGDTEPLSVIVLTAVCMQCLLNCQSINSLHDVTSAAELQPWLHLQRVISQWGIDLSVYADCGWPQADAAAMEC